MSVCLLQAYISESYDRPLRSKDFFLITFSQLPNLLGGKMIQRPSWEKKMPLCLWADLLSVSLVSCRAMIVMATKG